jgi:hypothetical protein
LIDSAGQWVWIDVGSSKGGSFRVNSDIAGHVTAGRTDIALHALTIPLERIQRR